MKIISILCLIFGFSIVGFGQIEIIEGTYHTFYGRSIDTYIIEGSETVLYIDKNSIIQEQLDDHETLKEIISRIDFYYNYYTDFFGTEPSGGDPNYSFKSPVAFVPTSCGAACGLIGWKGIEVGPEMFCQIFNERKYNLRTNKIGIVGYEFGRNFFVDGNKLLFPFTPGTDERNGGFAEAFAGFPELLAYIEYCKTKEPGFSMFQETLLNYVWLLDSYRAYINDLSSSPYKHLAKENFIFDINRSMYGNYWGNYAGQILVGTYDLFKDVIDFSIFFSTLRNRNDVMSIEDALGNIACSFSKAVNKNLNYYFKNVLKFNYDEQTVAEINTLPLPQDKLIRDKSNLWFTSVFDTINLNIRSINYGQNPNVYYELKVDDKSISKTTHGNNILPYSILEGKDSVSLQIILISNDNAIDNQRINLRKRDVVNLEEHIKDFFFTSPRGYSNCDYNSKIFSIENLTKNEDFSGLELIFPVKRDQTYYFEGNVANIKKYSPDNIDTNNDNIIDYYSRIMLQGGGGSGGTPRVGYDVGTEDNDFHIVSATIETNAFFTADWSLNIDYMLQRIFLETTGVSKGMFKDVIIKNITDTDNDGVIDFNDSCPTEFGIYDGCPQIKTSTPECEVNAIRIYPNPSNNIINIETEGNGELSIYDLLGNVLFKQEIKSANTQVDISHLKSGSYLIKIKCVNQQRTTEFIKL